MSWIPLAALLFRDSYMFSFYLYIFQSMSHVWDFHSIFYFLHQNQYTSSVQIPRKKNKLSHYGIEITGILVGFNDCSINRFVWKSDGNCQSAFVWLVLSGIPIWADTSWLQVAYGCPCTLLIIYTIETLSTQAQWMMARYSSSCSVQLSLVLLYVHKTPSLCPIFIESFILKWWRIWHVSWMKMCV